MLKKQNPIKECSLLKVKVGNGYTLFVGDKAYKAGDIAYISEKEYHGQERKVESTLPLGDEDKVVLWKRAFDIARSGKTHLNETDIAIFITLEGSLNKNIVERIKDFDTYKKCILLIGGDYDFVNRVVSYIWFTHSPGPTSSTTAIPVLENTKDLPKQWRHLRYEDYVGFDEGDIKNL